MTARQDAIARGERRYFSGMPCPKGHIAERSVDNASCVVCHSMIRARNREKQRAHAREHYLNNRADYIRRAQEWADANPEKVVDAKRRWRGDNPDYRRP